MLKNNIKILIGYILQSVSSFLLGAVGYKAIFLHENHPIVIVVSIILFIIGFRLWNKK